MRRTLSARRVPRKVGQDDDEPTDGQDITENTVKRPANKPKKLSNLRTSIAPSAAQDDETDTSTVVAPKKSNLSRIAIQRNASKRSSFLASELPALRSEDDDDDSAPSYNAAALKELKDSTPSTPQQASSDVEEASRALDLSSKFGSSLSRYRDKTEETTAIPSTAEIAEKKARRARLAKEAEAEEFISLDPDDPGFDEDEDGNVTKDDYGRLILKPKDKYGQAESRLVPEDEDVMEGFDEFTGDTGARIMMGASARPGNVQARKSEISAQIAAAEGLESDEESDASERARNVAFEAAQTRHGTYSTNATSSDPYADSRPKTPPKITPLPTLDNAVSRLRAQLEQMQMSRMEKLRDMEALKGEKLAIAEEEVRVQRALRETAEKFQKMREEKGLGGATPAIAVGNGGSATPALLEAAPGLGSIVNGASTEKGEDEDDYGDENDDEKPRLGLGMAGRGLESLSNSGTGTPLGAMSDAMDSH